MALESMRRASRDQPATSSHPYIIRGGLAGRERLRVLARATRPTTQALLNRLGPLGGARCLDAGCGGGDVTLLLATLAGPDGDVVGIDIDSDKLALARAEAHATGHAVAYRHADIVADDLGGPYDVIYARFLLTHLRDPAGACRRMRRALAPGGALVVEDVDVRGSFCHPSSAAYRRYVEIYATTARARGGDPDIGARLPELLRGAGFDDVRVCAALPVGARPDGPEGDVKLVSPLTLDAIADAAIAEGVAHRDELEELAVALRRLAGDPAYLMSIPRIVQAIAIGA
jgi:SAM-dependent methyltransferase